MAILVVDNSADHRRLLQRLLEAAGHGPVAGVSSAQEAFACLELGREGPPLVDLLLMDILMPGTDGIEACRRIKADPRYEDIPVLMVSAQPEAEDLSAAFAAGASDYIAKPVNKVILLARVRAALRLKEEIFRRKAREAELLETQRLLEEANAGLTRLATIDALTGVANRRQFDDYLRLEWKRASRARSCLSLILGDIDHFKLYNDTLGHQAGDECLVAVARALSSATHRATDLVARYGGEEFAVILPSTDREGARAVAARLQEAVCELQIPHPASPVAKHVTLSLGVAGTVPQDEDNPAPLVAAADQALYQAKAAGRDRIRSVEVLHEKRLARSRHR